MFLLQYSSWPVANLEILVGWRHAEYTRDFEIFKGLCMPAWALKPCTWSAPFHRAHLNECLSLKRGQIEISLYGPHQIILILNLTILNFNDIFIIDFKIQFNGE